MSVPSALLFWWSHWCGWRRRRSRKYPFTQAAAFLLLFSWPASLWALSCWPISCSNHAFSYMLFSTWHFPSSLRFVFFFSLCSSKSLIFWNRAFSGNLSSPMISSLFLAFSRFPMHFAGTCPATVEGSLKLFWFHLNICFEMSDVTIHIFSMR